LLFRLLIPIFSTKLTLIKGRGGIQKGRMILEDEEKRPKRVEGQRMLFFTMNVFENHTVTACHSSTREHSMLKKAKTGPWASAGERTVTRGLVSAFLNSAYWAFRLFEIGLLIFTLITFLSFDTKSSLNMIIFTIFSRKLSILNNCDLCV
jgi:hypothetical protein